MAKRMETAVGFNRRCVRGCKHHAGRAQAEANNPFLDCAHPYTVGRLIASTADYGDTDGQTRRFRGRR